jgi:hypothetical protein
VKDPLLSSALSETLRLQFAGLAPREVTQDTAVTVNGRSYELQKGSVMLSQPPVRTTPYLQQPRRVQIRTICPVAQKSDDNANR